MIGFVSLFMLLLNRKSLSPNERVTSKLCVILFSELIAYKDTILRLPCNSVL